MPFHLGSCVLSHSKRLMNDVIKQIGGFYNNIVYYTDTDSLYIHKKDRSPLVDNGFVGKSGWGKNEYIESGKFRAWILAANIKYCVVINHFGVIPAKRIFKGYSEEHWMIKMDEYLSLSEGKTVSGRFWLIGLKCLKELKYLIGNKFVQIVILEHFLELVL